MKNLLIDWKGFIPSEETKAQTENIFNSLKYILPGESDLRVCIEKYNKSFEGHIVVRSSAGDFAAHTDNRDLFALCKSLRKNIKHQVFKHKDSRSEWSRAS